MIDEKTIRALFKANMLRPKYADYQKAYYLYQQKRDEGIPSTKAFNSVGETIGMSLSTVMRAVKTMKQIKC